MGEIGPNALIVGLDNSGAVVLSISTNTAVTRLTLTAVSARLLARRLLVMADESDGRPCASADAEKGA